MKILLVAPLGAEGQLGEKNLDDLHRSVTDQVLDDDFERGGMVSREKYQPEELDQAWQLQNIDVAESGPLAGIELWLTSCHDQVLFVIRAQIEVGQYAAGTGVVALEEVLTKTVFQLAADHLQLAQVKPLWVSRTLVTARGESVPTGWIDGNVEKFAIDGLMNGSPRAQIFMGWGNNHILELANADSELDEVLKGLVDAQVIWADVNGLAKSSAEVVHSVIVDQSGRPARVLSEYLLSLSVLSLRSAQHHLLYDDLLLNIQGPRRHTAQTQLNSWRYSTVVDRVDSRIAHITHIAEQKSAQAEGKYQKIVEGVLFGLALAAFVGVVLQLISTAYIGVNDRSPGDGSSIGFLAAMRLYDSDLIILVAAIATIAVVAILYSVRRRA